MTEIKLQFGRGEYDGKGEYEGEIFPEYIELEEVLGMKPTAISTCGLDETDSSWLSDLIEKWKAREDREEVYEWEDEEYIEKIENGDLVDFYVLPVLDIDGRFDREVSKVYVGLSGCFRQITGPSSLVKGVLDVYENREKRDKSITLDACYTWMPRTEQAGDLLESIKEKEEEESIKEKEEDELNEFERLME